MGPSVPPATTKTWQKEGEPAPHSAENPLQIPQMGKAEIEQRRMANLHPCTRVKTMAEVQQQPQRQQPVGTRSSSSNTSRHCTSATASAAPIGARVAIAPTAAPAAAPAAPSAAPAHPQQLPQQQQQQQQQEQHQHVVEQHPIVRQQIKPFLHVHVARNEWQPDDGGAALADERESGALAGAGARAIAFAFAGTRMSRRCGGTGHLVA